MKFYLFNHPGKLDEKINIINSYAEKGSLRRIVVCDSMVHTDLDEASLVMSFRTAIAACWQWWFMTYSQYISYQALILITYII